MQIKDIWMSQRKLRNVAQIPAMQQEIVNGGFLPRIRINRDTDGSFQLEDGHHRLVAYWISDIRELTPDDYLLLEKDKWRPRFGKIEDLIMRCGIENEFG